MPTIPTPIRLPPVPLGQRTIGTPMPGASASPGAFDPSSPGESSSGEGGAKEDGKHAAVSKKDAEQKAHVAKAKETGKDGLTAATVAARLAEVRLGSPRLCAWCLGQLGSGNLSC